MHAAVVGIRGIAAVLAIVFTFSSLYYDTVVTKKIRDTMTSPTIDGYSFLSTGSIFSDLQIYPQDFQTLQQEQILKTHVATDPSSWTDEKRSEMRHKFRRHNRNSLSSLLILPNNNTEKTEHLSKDTVLQWGELFSFIHEHVRKRHKQGLYKVHDMHGMDFEIEEEQIAHRKDPTVLQAAWANIPGQPQKPRVIVEHNICHAFKHAKEIADFQTPHVLITHLNENWGALSSEITNRTANWGDIIRGTFGKHDGFDCDAVEVRELYLDSPNTLAVFTVQHQSVFDHPKVYSIPIGIANSPNGGNHFLARLKHQKKTKKLSPKKDPRRKLLMINASPSPTRQPQMDAVIKKFRKDRVKVRNTYSYDHDDKALDKYYAEMSRSKFILCPSGLGYDTYRIWESISMGAIPVIERYKYRYEVITYPPGSGKRSKIVRALKKGEDGVNLKASRSTKKGKEILKDFEKHNASLGLIEHYDGWRRTLDDLPVIWIDGEFGDTPSENSPPGNNYLTPEFLEQQYDAMAAKMESFRYEKLTSIYWIRLIESFLLLEDPSKAHGSANEPMRFDNFAEQITWQNAMESLSPTFNNHTILPIRKGDGWEGWKSQPADEALPLEDENANENESKSPYLFGDQQPRILAWVVVIQLKLLGLAIVIVGWTKLTVKQMSPSSGELKIPV